MQLYLIHYSEKAAPVDNLSGDVASSSLSSSNAPPKELIDRLECDTDAGVAGAFSPSSLVSLPAADKRACQKAGILPTAMVGVLVEELPPESQCPEVHLS